MSVPQRRIPNLTNAKHFLPIPVVKVLRESFDSVTGTHFASTIAEPVHLRPYSFNPFSAGTPDKFGVVQRVFGSAVFVMRFLVKLVYAKNDVDIAIVGGYQDELAARVAAPRFEVHSVLACYVVGDNEVTQSRGVGLLQGPGETNVNITIPRRRRK